jgi:hypothetical protein
MESFITHQNMAALSHINAASAVPSHGICIADVFNERKFLWPNLQQYPSIIPMFHQ